MLHFPPPFRKKKLINSLASLSILPCCSVSLHSSIFALSYQKLHFTFTLSVQLTNTRSVLQLHVFILQLHVSFLQLHLSSLQLHLSTFIHSTGLQLFHHRTCFPIISYLHLSQFVAQKLYHNPLYHYYHSNYIFPFMLFSFEEQNYLFSFLNV